MSSEDLKDGRKRSAQLRAAIKKIRRTPMPLADLIPLLQESADTIDALYEDAWKYWDLCN